MTRPNFVVILTDDQGPWTRRAPEVVTPEIDALAERGTEFTSFYCASPVCSPARASLLTGTPPSAHGVHDWIRGDNSGVDTHGVHYLAGLATTPELLAEAGYACAHSGKWHLGDARTPAPGFERWFAHRDGGGPYYGAPVIEDGAERTEPGYITEAITEHAVAMLTDLATGDRPFYLEVNYTAPHSPWGPEHHPADLRDLYAGTDFPSAPASEPHPWMNGAHAELMRGFTDRHATLSGYCAALTGVDRAVGRLMAALDAAGSTDSTYVVFHSDNGFACGHHGYWGKGNGTWPLNAWEPSVVVPFIVSGPGVARARVDDEPASALWLHPTLLELAGVALPRSAAEPSLVPRLTDGSGPATRGETSAEPVVICDEYGGLRMVRRGDAKLIERAEGPDELYLLDADPGELRNLIDDPAHAGLRADLHDVLTSWFAARCDPERDAWHRPVTGWGQNHPVTTSLPDADRYASGEDG